MLEDKKATKHGDLSANPCYIFMPIAIETTGVFGYHTPAFCKGAAGSPNCLGRRLRSQMATHCVICRHF